MRAREIGNKLHLSRGLGGPCQNVQRVASGALGFRGVTSVCLLDLFGRPKSAAADATAVSPLQITILPY